MTEKGPIKSYRDLLVWQKGMALAVQIYRLTRGFPDEEKFGLTSQMRRAAVSVLSNIAEGQARRGRKEFADALSLAEGSLAELDTQVELSEKLGFCAGSSRGEASAVIGESQKTLSALQQKLSANVVTGGDRRANERGKPKANAPAPNGRRVAPDTGYQRLATNH